ncbi:splicing factor, suppressor of white-apricot homolog isoform X2 [Adelges cooleyi]|uniref:splicing factor, suppressor of white-apricot homolog isoform X2 n=1 Tax=Adelges cooleyi TaxID=133065 RepID=UPI00217FEEAD|nr:splicing factor, suppressor of white-apricot homolog isoform X2 [Adelges cooleyi]
MKKEEELKRLHQALNNEDKEYGQVGYKYEDESSNISEVKPGDEADYDPELEEAFIPPRELDIPSNMHVPSTKKLNAIIEKTALFISKHGAQMEVLLKAKQAHNSQFEFLSYDRPLYPYYQHVLNAIRSCRYNPTLTNDSAEDSLDSSNEDNYLHPSLLKSAKQPETTPFIPNISYKPSADCSYSLLVNKIKEKQSAMPIEEEISKIEEPACTTTVTIVSEFDGLTKSARRRLKKKLVSQSASNALSNSPESDDVNNVDESTLKEENKIEHDGVNAVQQNVTSGVDVPPSDLQIIIDKMASYVTKNGKQFEETARKRQDPRLKFLEPDDCFNAYYLQKLKLYATIKRLEQTAPPKVTADSKTNSKLPVCFSLKKQKEAEPIEIKKSALEDSGNEISDDERKKDHPDKIERDDHSKASNLNVKALKKNAAKLDEDRIKDKITMAAKEKLASIERERTKKEKEKIQAERKRKAAQFLASMKIVSSLSKNSFNNIDDEKCSTTTAIPVDNSSVTNSVIIATKQTLETNEKNGVTPNDVQIANSGSSKGLDVISIGSSDEDVISYKEVNGDKKLKLSLQSRLQETPKEEKRKRAEDYEKEKDFYKRIKRYDEVKEKSPERYSSRDKERSRRRSKRSHSKRHSSSKDHKRDRSRRRSKHKHKSKKSKKQSRHHSSSQHSELSDNSTDTNNSRHS